MEVLGWVTRCSGQQSQVRLRRERRASAVLEDAHQSLLAPLPLRMSTQEIKGRVAEHRLARLDQGRRLSDDCRRPEAADVDRWSTGSSWVAVACSGRCMGAAMACVHDRLRIVHLHRHLQIVHPHVSSDRSPTFLGSFTHQSNCLPTKSLKLLGVKIHALDSLAKYSIPLLPLSAHSI